MVWIVTSIPNSKYYPCKTLIHHILLFLETFTIQYNACFLHGVTGSLTIQIMKEEQGKQPF